MQKALIVDDDEEIRAHLTEIMAGAGFEVVAAASGGEAVEKATVEDFDVVLLDLIMPRMSGSDVLATLRRVSPRSRVIMLTAFATIENAVDAIKRGASDYMSKPFKIEELLTRVRRVLEEARVDLFPATGDFDHILSSLSNPIRRTIIQILSLNPAMRLMDLVRALKIEDHTKVIFHLKILKEAGLLEQGSDKSYSLTAVGTKALESLKILEKYLQQ